jgi:hypothetical protein
MDSWARRGSARDEGDVPDPGLAEAAHHPVLRVLVEPPRAALEVLQVFVGEDAELLGPVLGVEGVGFTESVLRGSNVRCQI